MFRNKLQVAIATLALALAFVGATASADASRKHHNQQSGAEAHRQLCEDLKLIMTVNQDEAKAAFEAGDPAAVAEHDTNATNAYNDARHLGCGWASRVTAPDGHTFGEAPPPVGVFG